MVGPQVDVSTFVTFSASVSSSRRGVWIVVGWILGSIVPWVSGWWRWGRWASGVGLVRVGGISGSNRGVALGQAQRVWAQHVEAQHVEVQLVEAHHVQTLHVEAHHG